MSDKTEFDFFSTEVKIFGTKLEGLIEVTQQDFGVIRRVVNPDMVDFMPPRVVKVTRTRVYLDNGNYLTLAPDEMKKAIARVGGDKTKLIGAKITIDNPPQQ